MWKEGSLFLSAAQILATCGLRVRPEIRITFAVPPFDRARASFMPRMHRMVARTACCFADVALRSHARMDSYELLLFLHITTAILWLGAGATLGLAAFKATRSSDPMELGRVAALNDWLAPRLFIPASLATLLLGISLVIDGPWSFGELWIVIGLVGFAVSFLVGILYLKPTGEKISEGIAEHGPLSPEVVRRTRQILLVSRVELVLLFLVVADMAIKPNADDVGILIAGALILIAAGTAAVLAGRQAVEAG